MSAFRNDQTSNSLLSPLLPPRHFRRQGREFRGPEVTEAAEPGIDVLQALRLLGIDPARAV